MSLIAEAKRRGANMKSIDQITAAINDTIAARKEQLPVIQAERSRVFDQP